MSDRNDRSDTAAIPSARLPAFAHWTLQVSQIRGVATVVSIYTLYSKRLLK
jgi:hypothetical protein